MLQPLYSASVSPCGRYRFTLTRAWDGRPQLAVVMFNPSTADAKVDDPTITTLMKAAAGWGYGGVVVVNLCPLRSSLPGPALAFIEEWWRGASPEIRQAMAANMSHIRTMVQSRDTAAVLCAWGALADKVPNFVAKVVEWISDDLNGKPLLCLARTTSGAPKHPLARGKHRPDFSLTPELFTWGAARESA